jgi:hypothetical protein
MPGTEKLSPGEWALVRYIRTDFNPENLREAMHALCFCTTSDIVNKDFMDGPVFEVAHLCELAHNAASDFKKYGPKKD